MADSSTELDEAVRFAEQSIMRDILPSETINTVEQGIIKLLKPSAAPDEKVIFVIKQSRLHSLLDPDIILVTNRRMTIVHPSVWHHLRIQSWSVKSFDVLNYNKITKLAAMRGLLLISVNISILGTSGFMEICGLRRRDAKLLMKFVQILLEHLE